LQVRKKYLNVEDYTKQLKNLWYSKIQSKNKEYFKSTDGYFMVGMGFRKKTGVDSFKRKMENLRPKAKVIEIVFNRIKKKNRS